MPKKRFAIIGTGSRYRMFADALTTTYAEHNELVAFCDTNSGRLAVANDRLKEEHGAGPVLTYDAADFEKMIIEQRIDTVVVATIDRTHHTYLIRAMELGL